MYIPIIKADVARKIAEERLQLRRVMEYIWQLSINGEKSLILENLYDRTIKSLEENGYMVEERMGLTDNPSYYISWK
jgi:hypothetical protein